MSFMLPVFATWKWTSFLGFFSLLFLVTKCAYNLWFHPLSKVPGPLSARVSGIPSWWRAVRGDRHIWIWQLNQIYGPRVRIEPNTVIFCDPLAYNAIYNNSANVKRSSFYTALQRSHREQSTFTCVDPKVHAKKRKLLNLSFNEKSLRAASDFMIAHIDRWIDIVASNEPDNNGWTTPKDFSKLAHVLAFDIMGDLCFGKSPNIKEPGDNPLKETPDNITEFLKFMYPITRSPLLDLYLWLRPRGLDALMEKLIPPAVKRYFEFVEDTMIKRIALQEELRGKPETQQRLDMFYFLREAKDPDTGAPAYDKNELRAEANLLIIAGTDTTSVSLCGLFFYLVRDQIRLNKLALEIRSSFVSAEDIIPGSTLQSCNYLKACIEEGMRLTPAISSEMNREVKQGGMTINGDFYPAGVIVGVASWSQTRSDIYRDPNVFRPERWIIDEANGVTTEKIASLRANFHAFSKGPGSCPGKNMALLELMLTVAKILYCLDVRKAPGDNTGEGSANKQWGQRDNNIFQMRDAHITLLEGPILQFRKRDG